MQQATQKHVSEDLILPDDFSAKYAHLFPEGRIRWLMISRHKNGLSDIGAITKISGRLYIRESKFFEWVEAKEGQ